MYLVFYFQAVALPNFGAGDINGSMDTTPPAPPVKEPQAWEKPLTVPEIRKSSNNWSLASDAGVSKSNQTQQVFSLEQTVRL